MDISSFRHLAFVVATVISLVAWAGEHEHGQEHHHDEGPIVFSAQEREQKGIRIARVEKRLTTGTITAPGEVHLNAYRTAQVTPRIPAQVLARHARLGDRVQAGQSLVTLSSVDLAEAQGALIEADREWARVRKLGRGVISASRYIAAEVARQRAYATVRAYGLTDAQVARMLSDGDASRASGEFELLSPRAGTVIRDPFVIGELARPGQVLFVISDEDLLWVEAQLRPDQAAYVDVGATARLSRDGRTWQEGRVAQFQHRLDETTRTRGVRIEVPNADHALHAGDFVDVLLATTGAQARTAVPEDAVLLMGGEPTVFRLLDDALVPQAVEAGETRGGWTTIEAGLTVGEEIVVQGAFFLKSLALKSRMGEGHAH